MTKQLTGGFRKGNLEGWSTYDSVAYYTVPCKNYQVDFARSINDRSVNRLRIINFELGVVVIHHNIVTVSKNGGCLYFYDGVVDKGINGNAENLIDIAVG